jgi:hypothetical protein
VSSPASRAVVFEARAASDAVVVGGNTLRRDNPRLTTRRDSGHLPVRVVMSRTLDLPDSANLWDTQVSVCAWQRHLSFVCPITPSVRLFGMLTETYAAPNWVVELRCSGVQTCNSAAP